MPTLVRNWQSSHGLAKPCHSAFPSKRQDCGLEASSASVSQESPPPRHLPEQSPRSRRSGLGSMGAEHQRGLMAGRRPMLLIGTVWPEAWLLEGLESESELLFHTTCLWEWQLGCSEPWSPGSCWGPDAGTGCPTSHSCSALDKMSVTCAVF